jgi:ABC-type uncharacterized transport system substrate-binding protein
MRRRTLIFGIGGAAVGLRGIARAQQKAIPVLAYLAAGTSAGRERLVEAFRQGLTEGGYIDGKNVAIEFDWAGDDYSRLPELAVELTHHQPDLMVATSLPAAAAAKAATATIPIVFLIGDDPVKHGLAASFNRPGRNATGVTMLVAGLVAKRFQLLAELVPAADPVAVLVNPRNPNVGTELRELQEASRAARRKIAMFKLSSDAEIEAAFAALSEAGSKAVLVGSDPFFLSRRAQIVALAARYRVPGVFEWREFVDLGGLASYAPSLSDSHHQLGRYATRVLRGESPADLPIVQPTKFELVINLKTANTLGLTVPPALLARADEVIE